MGQGELKYYDSFLSSRCNILQRNHSGHNIRDTLMYWRSFKAIKIKYEPLKLFRYFSTSYLRHRHRRLQLCYSV